MVAERGWTGMLLRTAGLRAAVLPLSALCALTTAGLTVHYAGHVAFGFITMVAQLQLALPFADLGLGAAVARGVARAEGSPQAHAELRVLLRRTAAVLAVVGALGAAAAAATGAAGFFSEFFRVPDQLQAETDVVMAVVLVVFFLSLPLGLAERVLIGRDRADLIVILGLIPAVGNLGVVVLLGELGAAGMWLAVGLPASTLCFLGACSWLAFLHPRIGWRGIAPGAPGTLPHTGGTDLRRASVTGILLGGAPVLITTAGTVLSEQHGRLVLARLAEPTDVSHYAIALQFYMPLFSVLYMAATVLWPRFAVRTDPRLWRQANLMLLGFGSAAALGFALLARPVAEIVTAGQLIPPWPVVLGLSAALIAQSAHLTQHNLLIDAAGFIRQACMSLALLTLVLTGTVLGVRAGLGPAAPGLSMACGVLAAQVVPGLLVARRRVRAGEAAPDPLTVPALTPRTPDQEEDHVPAPLDAPTAAPRP